MPAEFPAESPDALLAGLTALAATETLLIGLDFDGTLAPLGDHPGESRALPEAVAAITALLALPRTKVALISGRGLASLREVGPGLPGLLYAGSHGGEIALADDHEVSLLTADDAVVLARLTEALDEAVAEIDGVWLEHKALGVAVHTRLALPEEAYTAHEAARDAAAEFPGLTTRDGKNLIEFAVSATHKGEALTTLRRETGATAVFFAGDDVTDEDALATLSPDDFGVRVGPGATAARFRIASPVELAEVLAELARLRALSQE